MLNIYQKLAKNRVFDSMVDAEFTNAIRVIEHMYSLPPIGNMSDRERNNLEYRLVNNYEKSLMRIYECYDKLLGITIPIFNSDIYYNVVTKLERNEHAKNIVLILMGRETFYGLTPPTSSVVGNSALTGATIIGVDNGGFNTNVKDFFSRFETISDMDVGGCCNLL